MSQVYFEEVEPGDELPSLVREPTREQLDAFTKVWGSTIGRFTNDEVARSEGFSGVILPGNMTMSFLAQFLTEWAGPDGKLKRLDVDFRRSVQPGDHLTCAGIVTDTETEDEENRVILDVYIETQKGERALQGTALVLLPSKP
ncbi:MAG: MaoC/PaaZ C-terminal domain-containing protein [Dehalococcoidia bacterium]|jgi:acyl dehydratase|nr:MaoC/PaaZ C-terminal domain-containing protein [Dehalococcoidia bacterium]